MQYRIKLNLIHYDECFDNNIDPEDLFNYKDERSSLMQFTKNYSNCQTDNIKKLILIKLRENRKSKGYI